MSNKTQTNPTKKETFTYYTKDKNGAKQIAKQYDVTNILLRRGNYYIDLTQNEKHVLLVLTSYLNLSERYGNMVKLTKEQIKAATGITENAMKTKRIMANLVEKGYIVYHCKRASQIKINVQKILNIGNLITEASEKETKVVTRKARTVVKADSKTDALDVVAVLDVVDVYQGDFEKSEEKPTAKEIKDAAKEVANDQVDQPACEETNSVVEQELPDYEAMTLKELVTCLKVKGIVTKTRNVGSSLLLTYVDQGREYPIRKNSPEEMREAVLKLTLKL